MSTPSKPPAPGPLAVVHRILRGRYLRAAIFAALLGPLGAAGGYKAAAPKFVSSGMIRVSPAVPRILYGSEENQQVPQYDSFLTAQIQLVSSRPVLELAVASDEMKAAGWPQGPDGVAALARRLGVLKGASRSELIEVTVSGDQPVAATTAVNAVLDAFARFSAQGGLRTVELREEALEQRIAALQRQLNDVQTQLIATAGEYGPESLSRVHASRVVDIERLDAKIADLDNNIAEAEARKNSPAASTESDAEVKRLTIADHAMANLLLRRADRMAEYDNARRTYLPDHPAYKSAQHSLAVVQQAIADRMEQLATLGKTGVLTAQKQGAADEKPLEQLKELRRGMIAMRQKAAQDSALLAARCLRLADLQSRRAQIAAGLDDASRRLEQTRVEATASLPGRVSIAVRAMVPTGPAEDRRKLFALVGFIAAALAGVAAAVSTRLLRPRIEYAADIASTAPLPMLGALPWIAAGSPSDRRSARRQIGLLRAALESCAQRRDSLLIAVTSAGRGEGKTNVALALARSLAASGRRTLLIDGDLAGKGLTRLLCLERRSGLTESVAPGTSLQSVAVNHSHRLDILPAGTSDDVHSDALGQSEFATLLQSARNTYAAVVVDTDSILTSGAAQSAVAVAGQVLLVVRRRQLRDQLRQAASRLAMLAPNALAGVVLNGAHEEAMPVANQFETTDSRSAALADVAASTTHPAGPAGPPAPLARPLQ